MANVNKGPYFWDVRGAGSEKFNFAASNQDKIPQGSTLLIERKLKKCLSLMLKLPENLNAKNGYKNGKKPSKLLAESLCGLLVWLCSAYALAERLH